MFILKGVYSNLSIILYNKLNFISLNIFLVKIDENKVFIIQLLYALTIAVVLLIIAMLFYPGGTFFDPHANSYRFFENFLSHLGREVSYIGIDNTVSKILFKSSIYLIGGSFIVYFFCHPFLF